MKTSCPFAILMLLLYVLAMPYVCEAQRPTPAPRKVSGTGQPNSPPAKSGGNQPSVLNVSGVSQADLYRFIHDGRFTRFSNDLRLRMTFEGYVSAYSGLCGPHLSQNKVEITRFVQEYRTETSWLPWGKSLIPYTTQTLASSGFVGTGIYAEPDYAEAYQRLAGANLASFLKNVGRPTMSKVVDAILTSTQKTIEISIITYADMNRTILNNGCKSPAMSRFSDNLLRSVRNNISAQRELGEATYFVSECSKKVTRISAGDRVKVCHCLENEMSGTIPDRLFNQLEDDFGGKDHSVFFLASLSRAGVQTKVKSCLGV